MRKDVGLILGGIGFAVAAYLLTRGTPRPRRIQDVHLTTADLDYQERSYEQVKSEHLTDLNVADATELGTLGLRQEWVDRIIENRPYRSKLELVSRMILPEDAYAAIRDRIAVAEGRDPIKVA